jgi:hypothetical protein
MTAEASFDKVRKLEQITRAETEREERGAAVDANTVRLRELRLDKERTDRESTVLITPASRRKSRRFSCTA